MKLRSANLSYICLTLVHCVMLLCWRCRNHYVRWIWSLNWNRQFLPGALLSSYDSRRSMRISRGMSVILLYIVTSDMSFGGRMRREFDGGERLHGLIP